MGYRARTGQGQNEDSREERKTEFEVLVLREGTQEYQRQIGTTVAVERNRAEAPVRKPEPEKGVVRQKTDGIPLSA
jgi:uncharacterized protein (UPF0261 family)